MSIIIKGVQMPSECRECPLCQYYPMVGETRCRRTGEVLASGFGTIKFDGRSELCQLVELPENHGDLIDRDALKEYLRMGGECGKDCPTDWKACHYDRIYVKQDFCEWLDDADVVIETENDNEDNN